MRTPRLVGSAVTVVGVLAVGSVLPVQASAPAPRSADATIAVTVPLLVAAAGPTPRTWQGGLPVRVAPRWWPQGLAKPSAPWSSAWPKPVRFVPTHRGPLSGRIIALDPGHDIGNSSHLSAINRTYWVGLRKICNTTGTATNAGYAESSYAFDVAARLRRLLTAQGATVILTRDRNSRDTFGPCIGARGTLAAQQGAALMVAIHADGGPASGRGFHVIAPAYKAGYTDDIYLGSARLAKAMVTGMVSQRLPRSTYLSRTIQVRSDTGAINVSDVPTVTVETLNMRNGTDARLASSRAGRQQVARGLYAGIVRYLR